MQRSAFLRKGANNLPKTFSQGARDYILIINKLRKDRFSGFSQLAKNMSLTIKIASFTT